MTKKEEADFQRMYVSLRRIAKGFMTAAQIRRDAATGRLGLCFEEQLEIAYDNIQTEAKNGLHGIRWPKGLEYLTPSSGPPIGAKKDGVK